MSYTYDQRKRPQGQTNATSAQASAARPVSAPLRADTAGAGDPSALETAMRERMNRTFGDLDAVKNYRPPAQTKTPAPAGPSTGPVGHAVSAAGPSAFSAGVMQAKKYTEQKSVDRDYDENDIVKEGAEGYESLDPQKWMTVTHTPTGLASIFGKTKRFKARIARKAYEMSPEELRENKYNPNQSKGLGAFQDALGQESAPHKGERADKTNGRRNREAWSAFQRFAGNSKPEMKQEDEKTDWDMHDMDHEILTSKLKNMSRMVQDYPELKGNIGTLIRIGGGQKNKDSSADDELGSAYMATKPTFDSEGFPLVMNAKTDAPGEIGKKRRADRNKGRVTSNRHAAELEYSGNHEMGHMLNFLLVKEKNRKKSFTDRLLANREDFDYQLTANDLVDRALQATMPKEEYEKLVRYEKDQPKRKGDTTAHKAGQINFSANKLGGTKDNRGYTSSYGATDANEFFAEAFADVYRNGKEARPTSIELVKLYEAEMAKAKGKNKKK